MNREQTWALEPTQIGASLFCDEVSNDEKARIAGRILATAPASILQGEESTPVMSMELDHSSDGAAGAGPAGVPQHSQSSHGEVATSSDIDSSPLTSRPTPESLSRGKPPLPTFSSSNSLVDFITPRSIVLFVRFCPGFKSWMTKNPPWDGIPAFESAKAAIKAICPINDSAERLCATAKRYKVVIV